MKITIEEFKRRQAQNLTYFNEQLNGIDDPNFVLTYSRETVLEVGKIDFALVGIGLHEFHKCFCPFAEFLGFEYVKPFGNIPKFREFDFELEIVVKDSDNMVVVV